MTKSQDIPVENKKNMDLKITYKDSWFKWLHSKLNEWWMNVNIEEGGRWHAMAFCTGLWFINELDKNLSCIVGKFLDKKLEDDGEYFSCQNRGLWRSIMAAIYLDSTKL